MNNKNNGILNKFYKENDIRYEIGIDEAGRGPMFGRVYSAAVILPNNENFNYSLLKDSKKFTSKKKLHKVYEYIKENALYYAVEFCDEITIDKINIRNATHKAMHLAIDKIIENILYKYEYVKNYKYNEKFYLLVDGNDFKPYLYLDNLDNELKQIDHNTIEGGDNKYCSIAAASILAKVSRDNYIENICDKYPKLNELYDLKKNKGYGTKKHMDGIKMNGISPWHRKTYGLCKTSNILDENYFNNIYNVS